MDRTIHPGKTPIRGGTESILLVDDEELVTKAVSQVMQRLGYQVTSHTSSIEALKDFKDDPDKFDIVITDMRMPEIGGIKLTQEIMAIRPSIPVIINTGYSQSLNAEMAKAIGIKGVLRKPAKNSEIAAMVRKALDC